MAGTIRSGSPDGVSVLKDLFTAEQISTNSNLNPLSHIGVSFTGGSAPYILKNFVQATCYACVIMDCDDIDRLSVGDHINPEQPKTGECSLQGELD